MHNLSEMKLSNCAYITMSYVYVPLPAQLNFRVFCFSVMDRVLVLKWTPKAIELKSKIFKFQSSLFDKEGPAR